MTATGANLLECASVTHKDYRGISHSSFSIDAFQLIYHHRKHLTPSPSAASFFRYGDTLLIDSGGKSN